MAIFSYRLARGQTRWQFTIDLPPAADGRRRQMNRKGFLTETAALAAETEARKYYARADLTADGSLAAELANWLDERELDVQETTLSNYRDIVRCYINPHLGSRLENPDAALVRAKLDDPDPTVDQPGHDQ